MGQPNRTNKPHTLTDKYRNKMKPFRHHHPKTKLNIITATRMEKFDFCDFCLIWFYVMHESRQIFKNSLQL